MQHNDFSGAAEQFLIEHRVLAECGVHGYTKDGRRDLSEVWPAAVAEFKRGKQGSVPWAAGMDQRTFTDILKATYDDKCGSCIGCLQTERE